jgi:integrase/recombinase XerD
MGKCRKLEDSEIEGMKAHTIDLRDKCILVFLEKTGYRANEVASLLTEDVFNFDSQTLRPKVKVATEHMKKDQPRDEVKLAPDLRTALTLWLAKLKQSGFLRPGVPLWLSRKHVAKLMGLRRETIWRIVRAAAIRAGVNPLRVGCHSYRKALAVHAWIFSDKNIMAVKRVLGHKNVSSTQAYLDSIFGDAEMDAFFDTAAYSGFHLDVGHPCVQSAGPPRENCG